MAVAIPSSARALLEHLPPKVATRISETVAIANLIRLIARLEAARATVLLTLTFLLAITLGINNHSLLPFRVGPFCSLALCLISAYWGGKIITQHTRVAYDNGTDALVRTDALTPTASAAAAQTAMEISQMLISGVLFAGVMLGTLPHMQFQKASWLAVGVVVMGSLTSSLALLWAVIWPHAPRRWMRIANAIIGTWICVMWWSGPLAALMHHKPDMLLGWLNQYSFFSDDPTWPVVIYGFMAEGISYVALYMLRKSAAWNNPSAALRQAMEITGPRWAGPGAVALTQEAQLWPQLTVAQTFETLDGLRGFTEPPPHREQMLQACKTLLPPPNKFIDECTFSERELVLLVWALSQEADLILIHRHESYQLLPRSMQIVCRQLVKQRMAEGVRFDFSPAYDDDLLRLIRSGQ